VISPLRAEHPIERVSRISLLRPVHPIERVTRIINVVQPGNHSIYHNININIILFMLNYIYFTISNIKICLEEINDNCALCRTEISTTTVRK
jgi:hypothetical protein